MSGSKLVVQTLGKFTLSYENIRIDDGINRSRKLWLLITYLLCNRNRKLSAETITDLLWGSEEKSATSAGALKITFWRARQLLEPLSDAVGMELLVRRDGCFCWNPDVPLELDTDQFEAMYRAAQSAQDDDTRLDALLDALSLYNGPFMEKYSMELWIAPLTAHYTYSYGKALLEALPLLLENGRYQEAEKLCRPAIGFDPYNEAIHQYLLRSLFHAGKYTEASAAYEELRELLFNDLGIVPSEETQSIYRDILRNTAGYTLSLETIREQLREASPTSGAIFCDYAFFKFYYQAEARSAARRGDAVHVGIFSVTDSDGKELAARSLDRAMENLRMQIQRNLRKSDVVSRCSSSQFVVLLLQANYENSCMVCERIIQAFNRAYPHTPALLHYAVMPLEPLT